MTGARLELRGLTWRPVRRRTPVLSGLDLTVEAGERVVLAGPSGCGKSTLLRGMAGLLQTAGHGDLAGQVLVDGHAVGQRPGDVALLLQDPTAAVVAETVGRDVAFGPENLRVPRDEIWRIVRETLTETSFPYGVEHPTHALSGGESQRLALAGGLALGARVLLLDEPTSMLDAPTADTVRQAVLASVRRRGTTLVVVEHHIGPWLDAVDRLVVLGPDGSVVADGPPERVLAEQGESLAAAGVWVPGLPSPEPAEMSEQVAGPLAPAGDAVLRARGIGVTLTSRAPGRSRERVQALRDVDAELRGGAVTVVAGPSGAGKSTLVQVLAGLLRPTTGDVVAAGSLTTRKGDQPWRWSSRDLAARVSWAPQLPEAGMVATTVREELAATGAAVGRDTAWLRRRVDALLDAFGLDRLADTSPYHLSGGEQRRLMVAAALAHGPTAALFDEPTVGQDRRTWAAVLGALAAARQGGAAVALATHDECAARLVGDATVLLPQRARPAASDPSGRVT